MLWKCHKCNIRFSPEHILDHIRIMHPDQDDGFDKWPDGEPVIHEDADEFFL